MPAAWRVTVYDFGRSLILSPKPVFFITNKTVEATARRLVRFLVYRNPIALPRIFCPHCADEPPGSRIDARKEIPRESKTATDAEVRAMEVRFVRETGANDPAIGYNMMPRDWHSR